MHHISLLTDRDHALHAAAASLREGGVIVFPTETVYGVGVLNGEDDALARLRALKGRDASKPFQILLHDACQAEVFSIKTDDTVMRLMQSFWPGPLTLVLPLGEGGTVGLRVPDHDDVRALIRCAGAPLVATSANRAGAPPPTTAGEVAATFADDVDVLLDGGLVRLGVASSVVAVDGDELTILRAGAIEEARLRACVEKGTT